MWCGGDAEHDSVELAIVIPDDYAYDCFRVPAAKLGGRCVYTKGAKHCSEVIGYACVEGQCFEWPLDGAFSLSQVSVLQPLQDGTARRGCDPTWNVSCSI